MQPLLEIIDLGRIAYSQAHQHQLLALQQVRQGAREKIIVCSHHPVVTLGRQTKSSDITGWRGDIISIERGGEATYHGPGQIIIYPILDLSKRGHDLHRYVRKLETATTKLLQRWGITAQGNPDQTKKTTGVWVGEKKIASIGIAIKHWISYHGIALNVQTDPLAFSGINPCGRSAQTMIDLEQLLKHSVNYDEVKRYFIQEIKQQLEIGIAD